MKRYRAVFVKEGVSHGEHWVSAVDEYDAADQMIDYLGKTSQRQPEGGTIMLIEQATPVRFTVTKGDSGLLHYRRETTDGSD